LYLLFAERIIYEDIIKNYILYFLIKKFGGYNKFDKEYSTIMQRDNEIGKRNRSVYGKK